MNLPLCRLDVLVLEVWADLVRAYFNRLGLALAPDTSDLEGEDLLRFELIFSETGRKI